MKETSAVGGEVHTPCTGDDLVPEEPSGPRVVTVEPGCGQADEAPTPGDRCGERRRAESARAARGGGMDADDPARGDVRDDDGERGRRAANEGAGAGRRERPQLHPAPAAVERRDDDALTA